MKRLIRYVCMVLLVVLTVSWFSGCGLYRGSERFLFTYLNTKWEADEFALYIDGRGEGVFVVTLEDGSTVAYDAYLWLYEIIVYDSRRPIVTIPEDIHASPYDPYVTLGSFYYVLSFNCKSFTLDYWGNNDGISPEWIWDGAPEKELRFKLTQKDLKEEDIPKPSLDPALDFCPVFFPGNEWTSADGNIKIEIEAVEQESKYDMFWADQPYFGEVTFSDDSSKKYDAVFGQLDTKLYIGDLISDEKSDAICDRSRATEIWECEYYETGFQAKVIRSERYEPDTVIVFTKTEK